MFKFQNSKNQTLNFYLMRPKLSIWYPLKFISLKNVELVKYRQN